MRFSHGGGGVNLLLRSRKEEEERLIAFNADSLEGASLEPPGLLEDIL